MINDNGGWEKFDMIFICNYPCNNKREAEKEEDRYMIELKPNLNTNRASRTPKQYRLEHVLDKNQYDKKYRENNIEKISMYSKTYREENKEKISLYFKKYNDLNWEHLNIKENCECGMKNICAHHMNRHRKNKLHERCLSYSGDDTNYYRCACGTVLTKVKKKRHETECKHHKDYIDSLNKSTI
jgi:hypothetical protein